MTCAQVVASAICGLTRALPAFATPSQPDGANTEKPRLLSLGQPGSIEVPGKKAGAARWRGWARLWVVLALAGAMAQSKPSEYDVKAAYLFNFGKFMRLSGPSGAQRRASFEICLLGHDPMGHVLDDITANESIDNRAVRVMRVSDAYAARECDVAFVSPDEGQGIQADLAALGKSDVLTVSDAPQFLKAGGMIQFVTQGNHVRFAVNLDAVGRTHLVLSSELLRVALTVTGKQAEGQP
jgi:YfiR/HmsC-like